MQFVIVVGVGGGVVVIVVLRKLKFFSKEGVGTSHLTCGYCLKTTQLGPTTLFRWKQ